MSGADADYAAAEEYDKAQHQKAVAILADHTNDDDEYDDDDTSSTDSEASPDENKSGWDIFLEEVVMLKWRILVLACFLPFGSYWVYDFPGSIGAGPSGTIQSLFAQHGKEYNNEMNQSLYSVYSWPNTVLAFFGGILIDNVLGLRKGMLLFTTLVLIGTVVFYFGVVATNFPVMLLGRFIFGLGGESLSVAQSAYVARWFRGVRGMALAFGITISFSRVGSSFNFLFSPRIATHVNVQTAVLVGTLACALSLVSCLLLILLDLYGEKKGIVAKETVKMREEGGSFFKWSDIRGLNIRFWVLCAICVTVYCAIFPFVGVVKQFFEVRYNVAGDEAATWVSFFQFTCAGGSTIVGGIVDTVGRLAQFMMLSSTLFTLAHGLFWLAKPQPIAMMMFIGVAYSFLASSLWPAVPYVVPAESTGICFGVMTAAQNAFLAVYPLLSGAILNKYTPPQPVLTGDCLAYSHSDFKNATPFEPDTLLNCTNNTDAPNPYWEGFRDDEILFMFTAALGILFGIWLWVLDARSDPPVLSVSAKDRPPSEEELLAKKAARKERRQNRRARRVARGEPATKKVRTGTSKKNVNNTTRTAEDSTPLLAENNQGGINTSGYMSNRHES